MGRGFKGFLGVVAAAALLLLPALAFASGNKLKITLPKTIPEEGYFNYTLTGKFDVKHIKTVDIWAYQAEFGACHSSLKGDMEHYTPYVVKAKGSFKLKPLISIGPGEKLDACVYADYLHNGRPKEVASTSATVESPAS